MWQMMKVFRENGKPVLSTDITQHLQMVNEGNYAYLNVETLVKFEMAKSCELQLGKERLSFEPYAIGLQNNSAYLDVFSQQ